jgi:hypothetical protein
MQTIFSNDVVANSKKHLPMWSGIVYVIGVLLITLWVMLDGPSCRVSDGLHCGQFLRGIHIVGLGLQIFATGAWVEWGLANRRKKNVQADRD